jgi:hypothetical protein
VLRRKRKGEKKGLRITILDVTKTQQGKVSLRGDIYLKTECQGATLCISNLGRVLNRGNSKDKAQLK